MRDTRSLLFCDRANGVTVVTAEPIVPAAAADVEAEVERVVAVVLVQRSRPVVAVRATVVEVRTDAVARSGQKDAIAIRAGDKLTRNTILFRPCPSTFLY